MLFQLFPVSTATPDPKSHSAIYELPAGAQPQNCEILLTGEGVAPAAYKGRHFLVEANEALIFVLVCSPLSGEGGAYAILQAAAWSPQDKRALIERAAAVLAASSRHISECRLGYPGRVR